MTDLALASFALHQADAYLEAGAQVVMELGLAGIYLIFGLFLPSLFRNNSMLLVLGLLAAAIVFLAQEQLWRSIGGAGLDDKSATVHPDEPGPVDPAAAGVAERRAAFRWWDPFFVPLIAAIGWLACLLCAASAWFLLGNKAKWGTASIEFFAPLAIAATFDLTVLLVMRSLVKRRGHALFASYLPSIGIRPVLNAALSGIGLAAIYLIVIFCLSLTSLFRNHPMLRETVPIPQSFDQLAVFGLGAVIIAPLTEELYWRGLVLDCLQRKLTPWISALITALLFSFSHVQFLVQPGIVGWMATVAVTGFGLLAAFWVQRTHSLRGAVAAHASYNATLILCMFGFR